MFSKKLCYSPSCLLGHSVLQRIRAGSIHVSGNSRISNGAIRNLARARSNFDPPWRVERRRERESPFFVILSVRGAEFYFIRKSGRASTRVSVEKDTKKRRRREKRRGDTRACGVCGFRHPREQQEERMDGWMEDGTVESSSHVVARTNAGRDRTDSEEDGRPSGYI